MRIPWILLVLLVLVLTACERGGSGGNNQSGADLVALSISLPEDQTALILPPGGKARLSVYGILRDGRKVDLTEDAQWLVEDANKASAESGEVLALSPGETRLVVRFADLSASVPLRIPEATLRSLSLDPSEATLYPGEGVTFRLLGEFDDGRTHDLSLAAQWRLTGDGAQLDGDVPGRIVAAADPTTSATVTVEATWDGHTVSATVTIVPARLLSLEITPNPLDLQLGERFTPRIDAWYEVAGEPVSVAYGGALEWQSDAPQVAQVVDGQILALGPGQATLTASAGGVTATLQVRVAAAPQANALELVLPAERLAVGQSLTLAAWVRYDDGSRADVTRDAAWTVSDTRLARIGNGSEDSGLLTALAAGDVTIRAQWGTLSAEARLTLTDPATLESIEISPAGGRLRVGEHLTLQALGHYSDGSLHDLSRTVQWQVDAPDLALVETSGEQRGRLTALAAGDVTVRATLNDVTGEAVFSIREAALLSLDIATDTDVVSVGATVDLHALGQLDDGSEIDLTQESQWRSDAPDRLAPDPQHRGRFLAQAPGTVLVSATYTDAQGGNHSALRQITVVEAPLQGLELLDENGTVLDSDMTLAAGTRRPLRIRGTYQDGRTQDLTDQVDLRLEDSETARLLWIDGSPWILGLQNGQTTLSVHSGDLQAQFDVLVTGASLVELAIAPDPASVLVGGERVLRAYGRFDDDSVQDLTEQVVWRSEDPAVALVSNGRGRQGLLEGLGAGTTQVTATFGDIAEPVTVTVTDDPQAVAGLIVTATPNVLLGYRGTDCADSADPVRDSTTLRVQVVALGEGAQVQDGTQVTLTLTYPDGSEEVRTLYTVGGQVETTVDSPECVVDNDPDTDTPPFAPLRVQAEVNDQGTTFVRRRVVAVTASFFYLFSGRGYFQGDLADGVVNADSRFLLLIVNPSNRAFVLKRLGLFDGTPDQADLNAWILGQDDPDGGATRLVETALGEGGDGADLPGASGYLAGLVLPQDVPVGDRPWRLLYQIYDPGTGYYYFWGPAIGFNP